jgi:hypothetical protein
MDIEIKHNMYVIFKNDGILKSIFRECNSLHSFEKSVKNYISTFPDKLEEIYEKSHEDNINKFKGDIFEILIEGMLKIIRSNHNPIENYNPQCSEHDDFEDDYGVDGTGTSLINKKPITVQIKFRSNVTDLLVTEDLKNFQGLSYRKYGVPVDEDKNLYVITNCKGVHHKTCKYVYDESLTVLDRKWISNELNYPKFWDIMNNLS